MSRSLQNWQWRNALKGSPLENMEEDRRILTTLEKNPQSAVVVRCYGWETRSATFGQSQDMEGVRGLLGNEIPMAKRPTAGGICLHTTEDLALSFFIPQARRRLWMIRSFQNLLCSVIPGEKEKRKDPSEPDSPWCSERHLPGEVWIGGEKKIALAGVLGRTTFLLQAHIRNDWERREVLRPLIERLIEAS